MGRERHSVSLDEVKDGTPSTWVQDPEYSTQSQVGNETLASANRKT